jgi:hypothetical protein
MLDYVYGYDEIISRFVADLVPAWHGREMPPMMATIGVIDKDGHLVAGILYNNYDKQAGVIEMSGAALPGARWLTRETMWRAYQYPFLQLDCQMVVNRVPADDKSQLRQLIAFNYAPTLLPRMLGRDRDLVVCRLTREAWEANKFNRKRDVLHVATTEKAA